MWPLSRLVSTRPQSAFSKWIVLAFASLTLISFAVIVTMAIVHPRPNEVIPETTRKIKENPIVPTAQNRPEPTVTLWVFQLRNGGFLPGQVTGKAGNYEFLITNISGELEGAVRLESETGKTVDVINLKRGRSVRKPVYLAPGNYILRLAKHRDWLTRITITQD